MKKIKKYIIIVFILFVLLIIQSRNPNINGPFKGILGNIINPIIYYSNSVTNFFGNITDNYIFLINVKKENDLLKEEINKLKLENIILNEKKSEFERLKRLLKFKEAYNFETIACNIIAKNIDSYVKYYIIDRGKVDGIKKNDAIISFNGVVGYVSEIYHGTSKVNVILNVQTNVSVINKRTRITGILSGSGKGDLIVRYYDKLDQVEKGDLIVTSGLGGIYPKGIPVGKVVRSFKSDTGIFQQLEVIPIVNFNKIENVLVIKNVVK
jgi:rod shape-determining protein MreC